MPPPCDLETLTFDLLTLKGVSEWCTIIWATNQLGDRRLGDNLNGQQPLRHSFFLVNFQEGSRQSFFVR